MNGLNTLYVVLFDGEVEVLFDAYPVVSDGTLRCLDGADREIRRYDSETVLMYGFNEQIKALAAAMIAA
jgi:hypothetical protein